LQAETKTKQVKMQYNTWQTNNTVDIILKEPWADITKKPVKPHAS
jgi:hypothetical protein